MAQFIRLNNGFIYSTASTKGEKGGDEMSFASKCLPRESVLNYSSAIGPIQIVADRQIAKLLLKSKSIEGTKVDNLKLIRAQI